MIVPKGFNWQYVSTGSGNGLAPNKCQAITWSSVDLDIWCQLASLGHKELIQTVRVQIHVIL